MFNEFSSGDIVNGWYVFQDGIPLLSLGTSVLRMELLLTANSCLPQWVY